MYRALAGLSVLLSVVTLPSLSQGHTPSAFNAYFNGTHARLRPLPAERARTNVLSHDRKRGVPTFARVSPPEEPAASSTSFEEAARNFLKSRAALYRLTNDAVDQATVAHVHDIKRGGVIVTFKQQLSGVPIIESRCSVLLDRNRRLLAIGGNLRPETQAPSEHFALTEAQAVAAAFTDRFETPLPVGRLSNERPARGGYVEFDLDHPVSIDEGHVEFATPARIRASYFPLPTKLAPAYYVELDTNKRGQASATMIAYVISATDGRVLMRKSLTQNDAFNYRVFADDDAEARPLDGPIGDFTPHPTGTPNQSYPGFVKPILVSIEGMNKNPNNTADPWLPADATATRGNNVDAYTDGGPQGFSTGDLRAELTGPKSFDHVYDTSEDALANDTQKMASITQLFFVNNWLHDYYYDSGFNEEAGNAQHDNYGRGGFQGDRLLAEGQDNAPSSLNNANMSTPADGKSPRMQMFVFSGKTKRSLEIGSLNKNFPTGAASFGPSNFNVTAEVVLADDGSGNTADACQAINNDVSGRIVLIDRGTCTFVSKVQRAQSAGAAGVIIANNQGNQGPPPLGGNGNTSIGALSVTQSDGNAIKNALPVTATLLQENGPRHDGTIDNLIVAHEWGHYIHHRLVQCSGRQCAGQSEGWADFLSLMTAVRQGDDLDGTFAASVYAPVARLDPGYFGIRRAPYSVDMNRNGFTFKHISNGQPLPETFPRQGTSPENAEVHNTGEVWASMLFEGYVGLLKRSQGDKPPYSFAEARRRMADYLVAGMKLAPVEPTFNEQRDAILAAAAARDFDDMMLLANGFAKRGAGSCSVAPPRDTRDNVGVVESFEVGAALNVASITLSDDVDSCDEDGVLDAGERGTLTIEINNTGPLELKGATLNLETESSGVTLADGGVVNVDSIPPLGSAEVKLEVSIIPNIDEPIDFELQLSADAPGACNDAFTKSVGFRLNYDDVANTSIADDFESGISVWTPKGAEANNAWSRVAYKPLDRVWNGIDTSHITDTNLESPDLEVGDEEFKLTLVHRHSFETDDEPTYWDGGVIEISSDGGQTWQDVVDFEDPGYGGPLSDQADNPLSNRKAFAATNPSWPNTDEVSVSFGTAFAGETVRVRFRIGTDQAAGDVGWYIHRVSFDGLTNSPFPSVTPDQTACNPGPEANAGADQKVSGGQTVTLDGSESTDPGGASLTYSWVQTSGEKVTLDRADSEAPSFVAPASSDSLELSFELTVDNGLSSDTDEVTVTVEPAQPDGMFIVQDGCGCSVPGTRSTNHAPLAAALLGLLLIGRRRRQNH